MQTLLSKNKTPTKQVNGQKHLRRDMFLRKATAAPAQGDGVHTRSRSLLSLSLSHRLSVEFGASINVLIAN